MISFGKARIVLVIVAGSALALVADDRSNRTLSAAHTDRFNVPASVSIQLENSFGEIEVDGWDLPEVEVTVTKSVEDLAIENDRVPAAPGQHSSRRKT